MARDYKELTGSLMCLEALRRYRAHQAIKNSKIYFGQPPILEYLVEHGHCTQAEIAAATGVSPASTAVSLKRMQKSGLIEKVSDDKDLRCNKITITELGIRLLDEVHRSFDGIDRLAYSGFSDGELEQFETYVDRIITNLSGDCPDRKDVCKILHSQLHVKGGDGR